jgi:hypothetical protein
MTSKQAQRTAPYVVGGIRALSDIAWMARRQASYPAGASMAQEFNEANWLLHEFARTGHINVGHPDPTANRNWDNAPHEVTETPSFYTDGAPTDFTPDAARAAELKGLDRAEAVQWMVSVIHPLAHPYADGASTYAPGMLNDATRALRNAGFDLSTTEALGKSVWVTDGMGDSFLRLTREEIAERDAARTAHTFGTN